MRSPRGPGATPRAGTGGTLFPFSTSLLRQMPFSFAKICGRCANRCLKMVVFLANLRYTCYRSGKETLLWCSHGSEDGYEDGVRRIPCLELTSPVHPKLSHMPRTGDRARCLRKANMQSSPPKEVASTYELTARAASHCAVSRRPSQPRQTSRSRKTPGRLVPICNRTSAAAFTHASGSRAFGVAPSTTASAQGKRSPRSPSADRTGGGPLELQSRCSRCSRSCVTSMSCSGI